VLDATGCYVMPGGIDPHTHLEMPFMGTYSSDDFESGTRAALAGGTTMVVDFACPPGQGLLDAIQMWDNKSTRANCDYSFHMAVTWWGEQVFNEMEDRGRGARHQHLQALHGLQGRADGERRRDVRLVQALAELGASPWSMPRTATWWRSCRQKLLAEGNTGPEAHAYSRPPQVEGEATNRAIMIADMAGVPLYVVHVSCEEAHEAIRRARQQGKRVWGEPLIQHLTLDESEYFNPTGTMPRAA
jgi:dihydropyrimidinase